MKTRRDTTRSRAAVATGFALPLVVLSLAAGIVAIDAPAAGEPELLPDLVTLPPSEMFIAAPKPKVRQLRFGNTIANVGAGVLELTSVQQDCNGDGKARNERAALQRVFADTDSDGAFTRGTDQVSRTVFSGCFDFHPSHHHWHFENFALYELTRLTGSARGEVVATTAKVSFCILDSYRSHPAMPGSPGEKYFSACSRDGDQGLSVGWADVYGPYLAGQDLGISGLANGTYCLVSTVDPANQLVESNEDNNETGLAVAISGTTVTPGGAC